MKSWFLLSRAKSTLIASKTGRSPLPKFVCARSIRVSAPAQQVATAPQQAPPSPVVQAPPPATAPPVVETPRPPAVRTEPTPQRPTITFTGDHGLRLEIEREAYVSGVRQIDEPVPDGIGLYEIPSLGGRRRFVITTTGWDDTTRG